MKIDMTKVATIGGLVLSLAGSVAATWAGDRKMNDRIAKEVEKAVKNLK